MKFTFAVAMLLNEATAARDFRCAYDTKWYNSQELCAWACGGHYREYDQAYMNGHCAEWSLASCKFGDYNTH